MFDRLTGAVEWAQHRHASSIVAGLAGIAYLVFGWYLDAPRDYALVAMIVTAFLLIPIVNHLHPQQKSEPKNGNGE